jgi:hypothetical protein
MKNQIEKWMKRLIIPVLIFMITSCSKDVEICISGDMSPDLPGTYTYTWCGENAEDIEWNFNGTVYAGQSVTLDLEQKQDYYLEVKGKGKRKESTETFTISVGIKELRVEPLDCNGNYLSNGDKPRAYLYSSRTSFQTDYRNNTKTNCLDSMDLAKTTFYGGTNSNSISFWNGGFTNLANGEYFVFVEEKGISTYINNLQSSTYLGNTNASISESSMDGASQIIMNSTNTLTDYNFMKNLFSKTFLLTSVTINSVNTGVSSCNADDSMIFNIDGTWSHNVGADDCTGAQSNSTGTISYGNYCSSISTNSFSGVTSSGTFASNFSAVYVSQTVIKVIATSGSNVIEQEYTAQ